MVRMSELLNRYSLVSSRRWIAIRSAQTLGVTSVAMTLGVLYQVAMWRAVDPQLSWLLGANFVSLAGLAGVAFRKSDEPIPEGESTTTVIQKVTP